MNPTLKAAILSAFTLAAHCAQAQETTALNFTLYGCASNGHEYSLPIQSQITTSPNKNELSDSLLKPTQTLANKLQQRFKRSMSAINEQTTPQEVMEIFAAFYSEKFNKLITEYRQEINESLPDSHTLDHAKIVTREASRNELGCQETQELLPNS